jgi:hypothetical protein
MFSRVTHEDWTNIVPMIAFAVMFTVFLITTIRALRLKPEERERLATMPLKDSEKADR